MVPKSFRILLKISCLVTVLASAGCPQKDRSTLVTPTTKSGEPFPSIGADKNLSPKQTTSQADSKINAMKASLSVVIRAQQAAKKQNDVIRVNCVNDALIQVKKLLNIAEVARNDLTEAIANKDNRDRSHQLSKVTIAGENVSVLTDEARACVGDDLIFVGDSPIDVQRPLIIDDPTKQAILEIIAELEAIERPALASPFGI